MHVTVQQLPEKTIVDLEIKGNATILDVLMRMALTPDAHIVLCEGVPLPSDTRLVDGQHIDIIKVASGG